jgi:hypothetical protein
MRGFRFLPVLALLAVLYGCSGAPPVDRFKIKVAEDGKGYTFKTTDPLMPLDNGRLRLAGPLGWERLSGGFSHLVRFEQGTDSGYPKIEISVEESPATPYDEFDSITKDNVVAFAKKIDTKIFTGEHPGVLASDAFEPPRPMIIGGVACVRYVLPAKVRRGAVVYDIERQYLETIHNRRLYRIELSVIEDKILNFRDASYSVLASIEFLDTGEEDSGAEGASDAGVDDDSSESPFAPRKERKDDKKKRNAPATPAGKNS